MMTHSITPLAIARRCGLATVCCALTLVASPAAASPTYPGVIQDALGSPCAPPCTVCHRTNQGGLGTIAPDSFGAAMVEFGGLRAADEGALRCALQLLDPGCASRPECAADTLDCASVDTDADGHADVAELRDSTDPNSSGNAALCGPRYGCGATVAGTSRTGDSYLLLVAAAAAVGLAAARRRLR